MTRRIVSLVPSLTETICSFDLKDELVGCTSFCIEPKGLHRTASVIGGPKDPDLNLIEDLNPTHILVNREENQSHHIEGCETIASTFSCLPKSPEDVPELLGAMGDFLEVPSRADPYVEASKRLINQLLELKRVNKDPFFSKQFLYFIWREPYMLASSDTFISRMLELVGFQNVSPIDKRYPSVSIDEIAGCGPELIFFSSEPYPFRRRDAERLQSEWQGTPPIVKLDGQLLSWYGTKTVEALEQLYAWASAKPQHLVEWR